MASSQMKGRQCAHCNLSTLLHYGSAPGLYCLLAQTQLKYIYCTLKSLDGIWEQFLLWEVRSRPCLVVKFKESQTTEINEVTEQKKPSETKAALNCSPCCGQQAAVNAKKSSVSIHSHNCTPHTLLIHILTNWLIKDIPALCGKNYCVVIRCASPKTLQD